MRPPVAAPEALTIRCRYCGAPAAEQCWITGTQLVRPWPHDVRLQDAALVVSLAGGESGVQ